MTALAAGRRTQILRVTRHSGVIDVDELTDCASVNTSTIRSVTDDVIGDTALEHLAAAHVGVDVV